MEIVTFDYNVLSLKSPWFLVLNPWNLITVKMNFSSAGNTLWDSNNAMFSP